MSLFNLYNQRNIQDRQVDTLIGLSKGLIADGKIVQAEVEFLYNWLIQNQHSEHPIIINLLDKVTSILDDGVVDSDEADDLLSLLHNLSGDESEIGELIKTTSLPIDLPLPKLDLTNKNVLFTGTFAFGTRKECEAQIKESGGNPVKNVTKSLHYLILGTYVTDSWAHENFGRKIEKAMEYRELGQGLIILTEEHWLKEVGL